MSRFTDVTVDDFDHGHFSVEWDGYDLDLTRAMQQDLPRRSRHFNGDCWVVWRGMEKQLRDALAPWTVDWLAKPTAPTPLKPKPLYPFTIDGLDRNGWADRLLDVADDPAVAAFHTAAVFSQLPDINPAREVTTAFTAATGQSAAGMLAGLNAPVTADWAETLLDATNDADAAVRALIAVLHPRCPTGDADRYRELIEAWRSASIGADHAPYREWCWNCGEAQGVTDMESDTLFDTNIGDARDGGGMTEGAHPFCAPCLAEILASKNTDVGFCVICHTWYDAWTQTCNDCHTSLKTNFVQQPPQWGAGR